MMEVLSKNIRPKHVIKNIFNNDLDTAVIDRIFLDADSGVYASQRDVQYKLKFNCIRIVIFIIVALLYPFATEFYCSWTQYNRFNRLTANWIQRLQNRRFSCLHASTDSVPWRRPSCYQPLVLLVTIGSEILPDVCAVDTGTTFPKT